MQAGGGSTNDSTMLVKEHDRTYWATVQGNALTTNNWSTVSGVLTHHDFLDQGPL